MEKHTTRKLSICYVRHGQTPDNVDKVISGHRNVSLTPVGLNQAQQTGEALGNAQFDFVYVSNMNRTKQTFEGIISKATHLSQIKVEYLPLIRERCGGILQGKKSILWAQNAAIQNKDIRNYKCDQAESWEDVYHRSRKYLHQLIKTHLISQNDFNQKVKSNDASEQITKILTVTHGGFINQTHNLMNWLQSKRPAVFNDMPKNCSFHEFEIAYQGNTEEIDDQLIQVRCVKNNITHYH